MSSQPILSAREGERGFALISALLVVLLASILGAAFMSAVTGPRYSSGIITSVRITGSSSTMLSRSALWTASAPAA